MTIKNKVLVLGLLFFIAISAGQYFYNKNICNPEWQQIKAGLNQLKTPNSIKKIQLFRAYPDDQSNLVSDSITITSDSVVEEIRTMIVNRNTNTWNRPLAEWNVVIKITMDNDQTLSFRVSKISNDQLTNMTHIYFGSKHCKNDSLSYSLELGTYLEEITGYKNN
jgi:hypothetical protein